MGQNSVIEWTDHTFNPWWGCVKISPGCDHCYAAAFDHRLGGNHWGPHSAYRLQSDLYWRKPHLWNRKGPARVFCASMADVFDKRAPGELRARLWDLIRATPNLEWLLLTKRPQNIDRMLPDDWGWGYPNVRLGVTTENQREADRRVPILLSQYSALPPFISAEPLLGPIAFGRYWPALGWIIAGGESGPNHRPAAPGWFLALRDGCRRHDIPFYFKQWGGTRPKVNGKALDGREWCEFPSR